MQSLRMLFLLVQNFTEAAKRRNYLFHVWELSPLRRPLSKETRLACENEAFAQDFLENCKLKLRKQSVRARLLPKLQVEVVKPRFRSRVP